MPESSLTLQVAGRLIGPDAISSLVECQIEEAADAADAAVVVATVEAGADGEWTSILDPLTVPRSKLVVEVTRAGVTYRFEGASTEAQWSIKPGGSSQLTVKAVDRSLEMDDREKVAAWPGSSDSGIAEAIFANYGIATKVKDTPAGPDPDVHAAMQRGTDWAFLRALAAKWGYAAYLKAGGGRVTGHFHPLEPLADPQAELSFGYGMDAPEIKVEANLSGGQSVSATRFRPLSDAEQNATSRGDDQVQGNTSLGGRVDLLLSPADVDGEVDPEAVAQGLARDSAFSLTLSAAVDADTTGVMLRARRTVLVSGIGSQLSGLWLVRRVRHRVSLDGHLQDLTLVRNAVGLAGSERFGQLSRAGQS